MKCLKTGLGRRCRKTAPLGSAAWGASLSLGLMLTACSGSGKLMLGEVLPSEGTGGSGGSGLILSDANFATDATCSAPTDLQPLAPVLYMIIDRSSNMD